MSNTQSNHLSVFLSLFLSLSSSIYLSISLFVFPFCFHFFSLTPESERVNVPARISVHARTRGYESHRNYAGRLFIKLITPYSLCTPSPPALASPLILSLPGASLVAEREAEKRRFRSRC